MSEKTKPNYNVECIIDVAGSLDTNLKIYSDVPVHFTSNKVVYVPKDQTYRPCKHQYALPTDEDAERRAYVIPRSIAMEFDRGDARGDICVDCMMEALSTHPEVHHD